MLLLFNWFSKSAYTTGAECSNNYIFVLNVLTFDIFCYCQHFKGKNEKLVSGVKSELDLVALDINLFLRHILNWGPKIKGCESSILYGLTLLKKVLTIVFVTTGSDLKCTVKISSNSNVIKSHVLRQRYNFLFFFFFFTC